jgi:hypothetical protein
MVHEITPDGIKTPQLPDIPYTGPVYYVAVLRVNRPTSNPHIRVDASVTTAVKVSGYSAEGERELAARTMADMAFRTELGLDTLMDGDDPTGKRYTITVTLA